MGWETNEEVFAPGDIARVPGTTYLGPCLTPDEATALQARVAELGVLLLEARGDLTEWIDVAHQHREKYPHIMRDFLNDMEIVRRIDAALTGGKDE